MKFPNREISVFNMSALDLFASAMGAFMIIAILLFPYYMNVSEAESRLQEAEKALTEAKAAHAAATVAAGAARKKRDTAEAKAGTAKKKLDGVVAKLDGLKKKQTQVAAAADGCQRRLSTLDVADLDLVFAIDTTGSMGPIIDALADELTAIIRVLEKVVNKLRVGVVDYRDRDRKNQNTYLVNASPMMDMSKVGLAQAISHLQGLRTEGGSSCPEDVDEGVNAAVNMPWLKDSRRQVVVIGDAQAHKRNWQRAFDLAAGFAADATPSRLGGVYTVPAKRACPEDADDSRFFRELARHGRGTFVDRAGSLTESVLLSVLAKW